jgi:hypothetical protein
MLCIKGIDFHWDIVETTRIINRIDLLGYRRSSWRQFAG